MSTNEKALIVSVSHSYGTDACLQYTRKDIFVLLMIQVYIFIYSSVEASSPLKVLSFIEVH